jgi:Cu(I)/Ag(I) efflux system protein CusF
MKKFITAAALVLAAASGLAQTTAPDMAEAEIRKVDRDARKITLKHGPIKNLDMPPMTMVFQVRDAKMLDNLKAGDKVRFSADQQQGAYVVTAVEKVEAK